MLCCGPTPPPQTRPARPRLAAGRALRGARQPSARRVRRASAGVPRVFGRRLDGAPLAGLSLGELAERVVGDEDSRVLVQVRRAAGGTVVEVPLTRARASAGVGFKVCISPLFSLSPSFFLSTARARALSLSFSLFLSFSLRERARARALSLSLSLLLSLSLFLSLCLSLFLSLSLSLSLSLLPSLPPCFQLFWLSKRVRLGTRSARSGPTTSQAGSSRARRPSSPSTWTR